MIAPPQERAGTHVATHVRWPADRFYWGVLDGTLLPRGARAGRRRLDEGLGFLLESVLPGVAIEEVHAVYHPLPGNGRRYLACGLPRAVLEQEVAPGTVTLSPEALPPFVEEQTTPQTLNLLTGAYLPAPLRRGRRWVLVHGTLVVLACAMLIVVGLERRVRAVGAQRAELVGEQQALYRQVLGEDALRGAQPPALRLLGERRRLERTRDTGAAPVEAVSCAGHLTALLAAWPADVHAQTEAINVSAQAITVRARVPTMADAQRFADAFAQLDGWRLLQPQSETQRGSILVIVRLEAQEAAP